MHSLANRFIVELRLEYRVEAATPDTALRAVLPMAGDAAMASYSVRRLVEEAPQTVSIEPYAHLTKSVYKAAEVAQILGVARNAVYEKIPCIRVGNRRLYPRATIIDVLANGIRNEPPITEPARRPWKRRMPERATIVRKEKTETEHAAASETISLAQAAALLRVSSSKARELFESRKIYSVESNGKRIILTDAVTHFLRGGTPLQFVETLIEHAKAAGTFAADPNGLQEAANELRALWS